MRKGLQLLVLSMLLLAAIRVPAQKPLLDSLDKKIMLKASLTSAALFTSTFFADETIHSFVQDNKSKALTDYTDVINFMGSKKVVLGLNAVSYGTSLLLKDERLERTSLNAFKSFISSGLLTTLVKETAGRARPFEERGAYFFNSFPIFRGQGSELRSLPSGHATVAFAFFTPFAEEYSRWIYLIPVSVAYSRMYKNKHWASDVVLGATFGFLSGYFFHHKTRNIEVSFNKIVIKF